MRTLLFLILAAFSLQCFAQDTNKVVFDETSGKSIIVGYLTWEVLEDSGFAAWFNPEYEAYEPDFEVIDYIAEKLVQTDITVVLGTWCSDSRREVPRLLKILDYADFPDDHLTMIGVDRSKIIEGSENKGDWEVEFVPTIIFYNDGKEIGRIVENPQETLELDIEQIITNQEF